jgi:hypothetical protein
MARDVSKRFAAGQREEEALRLIGGRGGLAAAAFAVVFVLDAGGARADAIDGHWCSADGRHFVISGDDITTPAGTRTLGDYSRHAFSYEVPAGEAQAGAIVSMLLLNEETVHLWVGTAPSASAEPEVWHRCSPAVHLDTQLAGAT